MTSEEMLSRCGEQTESTHDPMKIEFETWDVTIWIMSRNFKEQVEMVNKMKNKEEDVMEQTCQCIRLIQIPDPYGQMCAHRNENTGLPG